MGLLIGLSLFLANVFVPVFASSADHVLESKLSQQLEAVLGPGNAKVTVTSETLATSQSRRVERSQPQTSQRSLVEAQSSSGESRRVQQEQFVFDTTETLATKSASLGARSVAIVYQPTTDPEKPSLQEQDIYDLVSAGMGFNAQRGDRLEVRAAHFDSQWQDKLQADLDRSRIRPLPWLWMGLALSGLLLGLALGYAWSRHRFKQQSLRQPELGLEWQALSIPEASTAQINATEDSLVRPSNFST